jgi:hypothetical protein
LFFFSTSYRTSYHFSRTDLLLCQN